MALSTVLRFVLQHPLNRHRRLRALATFVRWQLASRLVRGDVVLDWVCGARLLVRSGETGVTGNVYAGLHEFEDMAFVLHALRPGQLFADVGANVGSYTVLACAAAKARGVCFEPVPSTFERLLANLRINGLDATVEARNIGIGASAGTLRFTAELDTTNHAVADGEAVEGRVISVDVTTLDAELRNDVPAVLKIDVEGFETAVVEGAREVLANPALHSVIMELNGSGARYGYDEAEIVRAMTTCGFQTYAYEPFRRRLVSLGGRPSSTGNTLFVRDVERVVDLLSNAASVRVHGLDL